MPGFIARKLCPDLVIIPLNFEKYTSASERVREVFAKYDPNFSMMSLDEAYLDLTNHLTWRQCSSAEERTFSGFEHPELVCRCGAASGRNRGSIIISSSASSVFRFDAKFQVSEADVRSC